VPDAELVEEALVGADQPARVDRFFAGDQEPDATIIAGSNAKTTLAGTGRHHDRRELGRVEDGDGEIQAPRLRVDDLEGDRTSSVLHPETTQRFTEVAAHVIHAADQVRLIPERLRSERNGVSACA